MRYGGSFILMKDCGSAHRDGRNDGIGLRVTADSWLLRVEDSTNIHLALTVIWPCPWLNDVFREKTMRTLVAQYHFPCIELEFRNGPYEVLFNFCLCTFPPNVFFFHLKTNPNYLTNQIKNIFWGFDIHKTSS